MRNIVACLLASSSLWAGNVAALKHGDCIDDISGKTLMITPFKDNYTVSRFELVDGESIPLAGAQLNPDSTALFCRCDNTETHRWANKSVYSSGDIGVATGVIGVRTYTFIDIDSSLPFYFGMSVFHTGGGLNGDSGAHIGVPATSYASGTVECKQDATITIDGETYVGLDIETVTALRSFHIAISPRDNVIPAGSYTFLVPEVYNYRKMAPNNEGNFDWPITPETIVNVGTITVKVEQQCSLTGNSIYSIDLGAVDRHAFESVGEKPTGYEEREINITLECNGTSDSQTIDFYLTDGNDASNTTAILTTELDENGSSKGVGVVIEDATGANVGRLTMGKGNQKSLETNEAGELKLKAYPVRVGDDVAVGSYRAKATLVVEHD